MVCARRRDQGVERFTDDVFHLANLESVDLGPLPQVAAGFSQACHPDSSAAFFRIRHTILASRLSSGR